LELTYPQVTIRWVSKGTGQEPQQVTGIIIMETEKNPDTKSTQKWLINTVYSEFNSGKPSSLSIIVTEKGQSTDYISQVLGSSTWASSSLLNALLPLPPARCSSAPSSFKRDHQAIESSQLSNRPPTTVNDGAERSRTNNPFRTTFTSQAFSKYDVKSCRSAVAFY
jgi:hypothetical protein